jgi:UDP-N-acetyl-D-glucosamine dehydrogenase
MPHHVVGKVADALNDAGKPVKGSKILILGVAYKADVDDVRESPGLHIIEILRRKGAEVCYNDPHVPRVEIEQGDNLESVELCSDQFHQADCCVIVTSHSAYDWSQVVDQANLIVDTRNALSDFRESVNIVRL